MSTKSIRVRFAPSPTGYLHVGGLRTALYNYLFARNNKGKFILRIEDTDRNRYVEGALENLLSTLKWTGLDYDEGPDTGGSYGPYLQSERLNIYKNQIQKLLKDKKVYYCFCTQQRLEEIRTKQQKMGVQPKYDKHCLRLGEREVEEKLENGFPSVIRMNVEAGKKIVVDDIVRGKVEFNSNVIDDQILIKSDGYPTYHLANVVDDKMMEISHVIRGEEWLSSTPKHILLYDYFGWDKPIFAHLPLLLNPDRSKLSKRQGDVAVEDYRDKGYSKEALLNFVALLGWSAGDNKEFYTVDQLIKSFSLERVNRSGAIFNLEKLNWLNQEHLRSKPDKEILVQLKKLLSESRFKDKGFSDEYLMNVIELMKERVTFIKDYLTNASYFFSAPKEFDEKIKSKNWNVDTKKYLKVLSDKYEKSKLEAKEDYEKILRETAEELKISAGKLIHPLRLAVSGVGVGPGLFDLLFILGKKEVQNRIAYALANLN